MPRQAVLPQLPVGRAGVTGSPYPLLQGGTGNQDAQSPQHRVSSGHRRAWECGPEQWPDAASEGCPPSRATICLVFVSVAPPALPFCSTGCKGPSPMRYAWVRIPGLSSLGTPFPIQWAPSLQPSETACMYHMHHLHCECVWVVLGYTVCELTGRRTKVEPERKKCNPLTVTVAALSALSV